MTHGSGLNTNFNMQAETIGLQPFIHVLGYLCMAFGKISHVRHVLHDWPGLPSSIMDVRFSESQPRVELAAIGLKANSELRAVRRLRFNLTISYQVIWTCQTDREDR